MKVYISGAMASRPETFKEIFNKAQEVFEKYGHTVVNPAILPQGLEKDKYMPICLAMVEASDMVFMLYGWELSKGAKLEHDYAEYQGKIIMYESEQTQNMAI